MKILYVISSTETGGAEKALCELACATGRQGHEVTVLCVKPLGAVTKLLEQAGIPVRSLAKTSLFPGKVIQKIREEILSFKPDIVHAMLFRAILYTRIACANIPVKLVTTPHFNLSKQSCWHRWADLLFKEKDTLTIAESYTTASYLIRHQHYRKDKVFLLPNGVDAARFYKDDSLRKTMRGTYGFHVKTIVFISVARLVPGKNPLVLLQAFRNVLRSYPDSKLVYVGEGPERKKLEEFIRQSRLQENVLLAGEQTDINAWLNMADVFVLPSLEESLPLALLEALRVGLPCIVSPQGDMPLWVEHGKNGYVCPPQDITLLSCFMKELSSMETLRQQMGEKAIQKAANITPPSTQYSRIYQQIIQNSFHVKTV